VISDQLLVSPGVALPTGLSPLTFQFQNYQELEDGGSACYDGGILEVSTDGGNSFTQVPTEDLATDPYDGPVDNRFSNPLADQNAWCGDPQPYLNSIVEIDDLAGQTVVFRFRLGTDSSIDHPGWDIDDVVVRGCEDTADIVFRDSFDG